MSQQPAPPSTLPLSLKLGWGVGAIGAVTMMIVVNVMLLFFMVSVLGLSPGASGLVLGAIRLLDMVVDPLVGVLSDRTRSRWGRRRPWMFAGAIGSGLSMIGLFTVPDLGSDPARLAYVGALLVAYYFSYSMFNVPYIAMPSEMTANYDERTSVMSFRTAASGVAGLVSLGGAPFLLQEFGSSREGFTLMALIMGVCVTVTMLVAVFSTGRAGQGRLVERPTIRTAIGTLRSRHFPLLLAVKFVALFAIACNAAVGLLFQVYVTGRGPGGLAIIGTCQHLATIVTIPLWLRYAQRFEKKQLLFSALIGYALVSLSWLLSGPTESLTAFVIRGIGIGVCYGGVVLLTLAMLPDVTAYEEARSEGDVGGSMAGMFSGIEKAAWALAPVVTGWVLAATGYASGPASSTPQTDSALAGLQFATSILPAVGYVISCGLLLGYRLTRADVTQSLGRLQSGDG
jgi:GPH family glycoside/pentoside/hexuronide:cation symporter